MKPFIFSIVLVAQLASAAPDCPSIVKTVYGDLFGSIFGSVTSVFDELLKASGYHSDNLAVASDLRRVANAFDTWPSSDARTIYRLYSQTHGPQNVPNKYAHHIIGLRRLADTSDFAEAFCDGKLKEPFLNPARKDRPYSFWIPNTIDVVMDPKEDLAQLILQLGRAKTEILQTGATDSHSQRAIWLLDKSITKVEEALALLLK